MNTSSCNFVSVVLLTPKLSIVNGEPVCRVSISFRDDNIGDKEQWVHTMLRCHKSTATYAAKNLVKGDLIFVAGARYHVDKEDGGDRCVKRTHYFSHGSITKLSSAEDRSPKPDTCPKPPPNDEREQSINEFEEWLDSQTAETASTLPDEEIPF